MPAKRKEVPAAVKAVVEALKPHHKAIAAAVAGPARENLDYLNSLYDGREERLAKEKETGIPAWLNLRTVRNVQGFHRIQLFNKALGCAGELKDFLDPMKPALKLINSKVKHLGADATWTWKWQSGGMRGFTGYVVTFFVEVPAADITFQDMKAALAATNG